MKYILELEFEDVPYCKDCICSIYKFADESRVYCKALPNYPRCPITGRLNICPLKESETPTIVQKANEIIHINHVEHLE